MFNESIEPTFSSPGDAMPVNKTGHARVKYVHSQGVAGKAKFVPKGHSNYTGVLAQADYGIVRLSSGGAPSIDPKAPSPLAPAISLKWLRDGVDSANLVTLYSAQGQPGNWNFFAND